MLYVNKVFNCDYSYNRFTCLLLFPQCCLVRLMVDGFSSFYLDGFFSNNQLKIPFVDEIIVYQDKKTINHHLIYLLVNIPYQFQHNTNYSYSTLIQILEFSICRSFHILYDYHSSTGLNTNFIEYQEETP